MLPDWLDYAYSETAATSMLRGMRGPVARWGELIATAQATMSYFQELPPEQTEKLYDQEFVLPLIAAGRVLDTASQPTVQIAPENRLSLALTAAVAFGMHGNFPSARAVIQRLFAEFQNFSPASPELAVIIATSAPTLLRTMLPYSDNQSYSGRYLTLLEYFLSTGEDGLIEEIRAAYIDCILNAESAFEGSLLRSSRLSLEHIFTLAVARVLRNHSRGLSDGFINRLIDKGVRLFLPPQYKAIVSHNLINRPDNTIISLPTSTGKTLLGELCLVASLDKPGIACYLAPYVALGRQVHQSLRSHLPETVRTHLMVGGFRAATHLDPENEKEVIVATPERLDALLRLEPHLLPYIRCVVCDEAHLIQNDTRGIKLEGLLTRLRLLQEVGYTHRLVLLSAVLSQYESLRAWIKAPEDSVITDSWKPTARRLAFWKQNGKLVWHVSDNPIRMSGTTSESIIGDLSLPWPQNDFYQTSQLWAGKRKQDPQAHANVAFLTDFLLNRYGGPVLAVCATKAATRQVALAIAGRLQIDEPIDPKISTIIGRIEAKYPFLLSMREMLKRGVAFHNSTVPHEIRQLIEDAAKERALYAVAATTTLAEGVDLPFRFTILVDWLLGWDGPEQTPISSLLFRNVAGRCGRAGEFTEGDTIIFDNPVGDAKYTYPGRREALQRNIFLTEQPDDLSSAIELIGTSSDHRKALKAALASQFLAAVPENPDQENLVEAFLEHSYIGHRPGKESPVRAILTDIKTSLLDERSEALAKAASPLRLTEFGQAANSTGFSPESCRSIAAFLRTYDYDDGAGRLTPTQRLTVLSGVLIRTFGELPEQTNSYLYKVLQPKPRHIGVRSSDLEQVISAWLQGTKEEIIFADLPSVRRSSRSVKIQDWQQGFDDQFVWSVDFDKFVDFVSGVFVDYLPWLMRACGSLSKFTGGRAAEMPWGQYADMIGAGVDSQWAVQAILAGAPGSRNIIGMIGRLWPEQYRSDFDPLGLTFIQEPVSELNLFSYFQAHISRAVNPEKAELANLYLWLWQQAGVRPRIIS